MRRHSRRARKVFEAGHGSWLPSVERIGRAAAGGDEASRNYLAALAEASLLVMTADRPADGQACADVADMISEALGPLLEHDAVVALVREAGERLADKGRFARLNALAALAGEPADGRQIAGFVALLALSDHDLTPSELFVLHALGRVVGYGTDKTAELVRSIGARLNQVGRDA